MSRFGVWLLSLAFSISYASETQAQKRVIVVAPHPDDEVLGVGATLNHLAKRRIQGEDIDYRVVLMTCGDGFEAAFGKWTTSHPGKNYTDFGIARHNETLTAMNRLGIDSSKVVFLGFPDSLLTSLWTAETPIMSPHTATAAVPYPFALHFMAPYTRAEVIRELQEIFGRFPPTEIYTPTLSDHHPDHSTTEKFVDLALTQLGSAPVRHEYLIHWDAVDSAWPYSEKSWPTIKGHKPPDLTVPLTLEDQKRKTKAISDYVTQMPVVYDYLHEFSKSAEIFWNHRDRLEDYLSQPQAH